MALKITPAQRRAAIIDQFENRVDKMLGVQIWDADDSRRGGFMQSMYHVETRQVGFVLSDMIAAYVVPECRMYGDVGLERSIMAAIEYIRTHQRPDGCVDLTSCNYASPPDTAFMTNELITAWDIIEKYGTKNEIMRGELKRLIESLGEGVKTGGFHTPNHRWAISSCLLAAAKITGRTDFAERAGDFLREGLDINEYGEFAERSAGNYNQVNDDQMVRLFMTTGERRFIQAAADNLDMMRCYIDPDGSIFTNNSTRQDNGKKVYPENLYVLMKLTGMFAQKPELGALADAMFDTAYAHGQIPAEAKWFLLMPELHEYGCGAETPAFDDYSAVFPESNIARVRRGNMSYTVMRGRPNFLYFQSGAFTMYATVYANICSKRNFSAQTMERTAHGFTLTDHNEGWYYLPFNKAPATSDWWKMDNTSRKKEKGVSLDTTIEITEVGDGIDLHISTAGLDRLPLRMEFSFGAPCHVRGDSFMLDGVPGGCMNVLDGAVELCSGDNDVITLSPAFGAHDFTTRMNGAYPLSDSHFTVYFTAYTPVDKVVHISTQPLKWRSATGV